MGREIKRVALDFDYPINQMIWKGYHNPYSGMDCKCCGGSGSSPEYKKLSDDWYGFERPEKRWCHNINQNEVDALVKDGRLYDFTHNFVKGTGWVKKSPEYIPTCEEVNEWSKVGFGHDSINQWICVRSRLESMGITENECKVCGGEGSLWADDKYQKLCEEFEYIEPPIGEGYQLWCTTSEGTPMSPVFDEPEKLAKWLFDNEASSFGSSTSSYETWLKFIKGSGWAMSAVMTSKGIESGVDAVTNKLEQESTK